jgi:hypothetical protein
MTILRKRKNVCDRRAHWYLRIIKRTACILVCIKNVLAENNYLGVLDYDRSSIY